MKKHLRSILVSSCLLSSFAFAQTSVTGVNTSPANRIAVLEEFTGVRCPNCPDGHAVLEQVISTYGQNVVSLSYHPNNSSLTAPYTGDEDLRRDYANVFYSTPYCGSSRFMPSAFINRREYGGEKLQSRTVWSSYVGDMINETSPLNVGVVANYDPSTQQLTGTAEVYYTSSVTDLNSVYFLLIENGVVVAQQSGATGAYTQDRLFREGLSAQWGDPITPTSQGSLVRFDYVFDNTTAQYDMTQAEVIAFVENKTNEELYSGARATVSNNVVGIGKAQVLDASVYPNPTSGDTRLVFELPNPGQVSWRIHSVHGVEQARGLAGSLSAGRHQQVLPTSGLQAGIYFVHLQTEDGVVIRRLVVQ